MKILSKLFTLFISCLLIVACSGSNNKINLENNKTILAFGDSLTYGYGVNQNYSYPNVLSNILKTKVINSGVSGNTTENGLNRIEQQLVEHNPELVILGLGGNDFLRKVPQEETIKNLKEIIKIIKSYNAKIILLPVPKPGYLGLVGHLEDAKFFEELAKEEKILLIENIYSELLSNNKYKSDLIHLNEKGYQLVAEKIANYIIVK